MVPRKSLQHNQRTPESGESAKTSAESRTPGDLYTLPGHTASLGGVRRFASGVNLKRKAAARILQGVDSYSLYRESRRRPSSFRKTRVFSLYAQYQADLADVTELSVYNKSCKFLLFCINCFSRFLAVVPLRNKRPEEVVRGFKEIFKSMPLPERMQTDKGTEFVSKKTQAYFRNKNIAHFSTHSIYKAAMVERVQRTIKTRMYRYMAAMRTKNYLTALPLIVNSYNASPHRSLQGFAPRDVKPENESKFFQLLYPPAKTQTRKPAFAVGDFVRLQLQKQSFDKSFRQQFTDEVFKISEIVIDDNVITYRIITLNGEKILGTFYSNELTKIAFNEQQHMYAVERVLAKRTQSGVKQVKVRWRGFDKSHDSWIPATDLSK